MGQIVPITSVKPVDSLTVFQQIRLSPSRVMEIHLTGQTVYEFAKVKPGTGVWDKASDTYIEPIKELAMIIVEKGRKTFRVQYYSLLDGTQIVGDLTLDKLAETVQNLKDAGF